MEKENYNYGGLFSGFFNYIDSMEKQIEYCDHVHTSSCQHDGECACVNDHECKDGVIIKEN